MKPGGDSGRFDQGYTVCGCGKYAHVYRASTLRRLPKGYNGELCEECSCWMVAVEKLRPDAGGSAHLMGDDGVGR